MGFPNLPENFGPINIDLEAEDIAFLLLLSIAFEELSLAHIMNAEGEKLQAALGTLVNDTGALIFPGPLADNLDDLLETNRSVERMLRTIAKKEMLLQWKFEDVIDFLGTPPTATAACACAVEITADAETVITATEFPGADVDPEDVAIIQLTVNICPGCEPGESTINAVFANTTTNPNTTLVATLTPGTVEQLCQGETSSFIQGLANVLLYGGPLPTPVSDELPFTITVNADGTSTFTAQLPAPVGGTASITMENLNVTITECPIETNGGV
ncbi:hypothetical protein [Halalkalibacter krulwichiae]|uniref:Collagen triple helix repeat (20 copies) n=1 Tax=Halalkalibacter krulwichiae TaxID=199441 RepID=A0A1X9MN28_9BACI|nr:hypothetical protein [Halalkalibacter krulwichiae]ARK32712.1 hypothetical protein BkAM31D_24220 [Halalkalibacter krulwichiae]